MAVSLTIKEARLFEERSGASWMRTVGKFTTKFCRRHVLECRACAARTDEAEARCFTGRPCELHSIAIEACDDCLGPNVGASEWGALDWVIRRRTDPDAAYDEDFDLLEAMKRVGEAFSASAEAKESAPSSSGGSQPSFTGSPDSAE